MGEIIQVTQEQAYAATTFKELSKMYHSRDPLKFQEAIDKNNARYEAVMDEILGRK